MKKEKFYESPQIEIVEVYVEQGFANSLDGVNPEGDVGDMGWGN